MSITGSHSDANFGEPPIVRHRFSVDDYYRMAEVGILSEDDRVELIQGEIVAMYPIGARYAQVVTTLTEILFRNLDLTKVQIRVQMPVRFGGYDEPEPDLAVVARRAGGYPTVHPAAVDCRLLIEVADSSLPRDRRLKLPLYARAGITEFWLVDLNGESVEVCTAPDGDKYSKVNVFRRGQTVECRSIADLRLSVDELLDRLGQSLVRPRCF